MRGPLSPEAALGGHEFRGFFRRFQRLPLHLCHGPFSLAQARQRSPKGLYLDTETTGLAGGAGTYAFLIGLAYFEQDELVVEQLFMRSHQEEKAMLGYLLERVEMAEQLITFNGRTFDVPLLQTRLIMNRLRFDLEECLHVDLLPACRRLWSLALDSCRLEHLESEILGLPRQGDIPGWMVPQIFFRFLHTGDARGLAAVAEHNRRDLLAMVGLMAGLDGYFERPTDWSARFRAHPPLLHLEDLALAQQLYRQRRFEPVGELLERVWAYFHPLGPSPPLRLAGGLWARWLRRHGLVEPARRIWMELADCFPQDAYLLEQAAKVQEHALRNWAGALDCVERALGLDSLARGRRRSLLHRQQRLLRLAGGQVLG